MEQPDDIEKAQERFAKLVEGYDTKEHSKTHVLDPFEDHIRTLREQHVTYKAIKHLLEQAGVTVCHATVARFCQSRGLNPLKRKVARKPAKRTPKKTAEKPSLAPAEEPVKPSPKQRRGPRIANPKDI